MFCKSCGKEQVVEGEFCPYCGAKVAAAALADNGGAKNQVISVLLAFFLTFWTWLYTYKKDGWKFWLGLGLALFGFVLGLALAMTIPGEEGVLGVLLLYVLWFGLWVWALVDVCVKKERWYRTYS